MGFYIFIHLFYLRFPPVHVYIFSCVNPILNINSHSTLCQWTHMNDEYLVDSIKLILLRGAYFYVFHVVCIAAGGLIWNALHIVHRQIFVFLFCLCFPHTITIYHSNVSSPNQRNRIFTRISRGREGFLCMRWKIWLWGYKVCLIPRNELR